MEGKRVSVDNTLLVRVREIIGNSPEPITDRAALKKALLERYRTVEEMAQAVIGMSDSLLRLLRSSTYVLPEQPGLFDIPSLISIKTEEGVLFIGGDDATLDQVEQYIDDGHRFHSAQSLRFKRGKEDCKRLRSLDLPGDIVFRKARLQLETSETGDGQ
jgi:hypothetical protein